MASASAVADEETNTTASAQPPTFREPSWAVQPGDERAQYSIRCGKTSESIDLNARSSYVVGRDAARCAVVVDGPGISREHAALVHHENGNMYVIHLSGTGSTMTDGALLARYKTARLKHGQTLSFRGAVSNGGTDFRVAVVDAADGRDLKRKDRDDDEKKEQIRGPSEVRCSHILVKHRDSRRPSSWKEKVITRSKEDAVVMLEGFLRQLHEARENDGTDAMISLFEQIASTESHCSSARRGGDLGAFGRGKMQKPFEEASFALGVNDITEEVVSSDSGVHLILRLA